jgi:hypothetical protein
VNTWRRSYSFTHTSRESRSCMVANWSRHACMSLADFLRLEKSYQIHTNTRTATNSVPSFGSSNHSTKQQESQSKPMKKTSNKYKIKKRLIYILATYVSLLFLNVCLFPRYYLLAHFLITTVISHSLLIAFAH